MPKVLGIIPARLESTRLPGKLLLNETGKPLIVHTIEQALKANLLDEVIVGTDSPQIEEVCKELVPVVHTSKLHQNGTSRCYEAFRHRVEERARCDYYIVNIQADQPEISPEVIDTVVLSQQFHGNGISTAACRIPEGRGYEFNRKSVVKVVCDRSGKAMYFSRSPIPHKCLNLAMKHIGIYAFTEGSLYGCSDAPRSALAEAEGLEQLRWMACGASVYVCETVDYQQSGIDTTEDYRMFVERWQNRPAE